MGSRQWTLARSPNLTKTPETYQTVVEDDSESFRGVQGAAPAVPHDHRPEVQPIQAAVVVADHQDLLIITYVAGDLVFDISDDLDRRGRAREPPPSWALH